MILKGVGKMSESKTSVAPANSSGSKKQTAKMLGFGGFFAMTASMVMTVYAYPNFASSGLHLIFFLILGGVFWFLPVALVAAEMATVKGWENGGIFAWVGNTLGKRWGFSALFYQWFQITVGFVTMASSFWLRYPTSLDGMRSTTIHLLCSSELRSSFGD